jgi:hypothetical protein
MMTHRPCLRALVRGGLLVALLLAAPAATAAPNDDDATSQQIAMLYRRANALYGQKKLAEAEALYLEAWRLKKTYDVACNFGAVELDLGKPRDAAEYLAFALREFPAGEKAAAREQIKTRLALARAEVGALRVRVNVPGAVVRVGDRAVGEAPVDDEVFVSPGTVAVSASAPGYDQALQSVQVAKGESVDVVLTLKALRRSVVPGAVLGGVAGAALIAGIGSFAGARGKRSSAQSLSQSIQASGNCVAGSASFDARCDQLHSTASAGNTLEHVAAGLFAGAGAAAAGAVVYFVWPQASPAGPKSGTWRLAPALSPSALGLSASGTF